MARALFFIAQVSEERNFGRRKDSGAAPQGILKQRAF